MAEQLKRMGCEELTERILSGQRNFNDCEMRNFKLNESPRFGELTDYLKENDTEVQSFGWEEPKCAYAINPFVFNNSVFDYVDMSGLYMPFIRIIRSKVYVTTFSEAHIPNAEFIESSLDKVEFDNACLEGAYFSSTRLSLVDFKGAKLCYSDLRGTDLRNSLFNERTDFSYAQLNGSVLKLSQIGLVSKPSKNLKFEITIPDFENVPGLKELVQKIRDSSHFKVEVTKDDYANSGDYDPTYTSNAPEHSQDPLNRANSC